MDLVTSAASRPNISCRCSSAPPAWGFVRSCQFTTRIRKRQSRSLPARVRVEHSVHEARTLLAAISFGESHRFLYHDSRRRGTLQHLGSSESQHRSLDGADAIRTASSS